MQNNGNNGNNRYNRYNTGRKTLNKRYAKNRRNRNFNILVKVLTLFVIIFGILIVGYTYREPIYNFLMSKQNGDQTVLNNSGSELQSGDGMKTEPLTETNSSGITQTSSLSATEAITETETKTETESKSEETVSSTTSTSTSASASTSTASPETAVETSSDVVAAFDDGLLFIDSPAELQPDFIKKMFDEALEIPESSNKIEQPPAGRSADLQSKVVPLSSKIPEPYEYFKNVIFLGDSVTSGFELYKSVIKFNGENVLQNVSVVAVTSYGVYNATREISGKTVHPLYEGKQMKAEDIIAKKEGKYVFICLGLNDLTWLKVDKFREVYQTLIDSIKSKSPGKTIVIMSVTPLVAGQKHDALSNETILETNNMLIELAEQNNIPFIDYAAAIRDSGNSLYTEMSSDGYCHIKPAAYDRLVAYLLYHPIKLN